MENIPQLEDGLQMCGYEVSKRDNEVVARKGSPSQCCLYLSRRDGP